jgi:hypothetical protein
MQTYLLRRLLNLESKSDDLPPEVLTPYQKAAQAVASRPIIKELLGAL